MTAQDGFEWKPIGRGTTLMMLCGVGLVILGLALLLLRDRMNGVTLLVFGPLFVLVGLWLRHLDRKYAPKSRGTTGRTDSNTDGPVE